MLKFFKEKKDPIVILLCSVVIVGAGFFSKKRTNATLCTELLLIVKNKTNPIPATIIKDEGLEALFLNKPLDGIKHTQILRAIKKNPYVYEAIFYKTPMGKAYLEVQFRELIAKIFSREGDRAYIDMVGEIVPMSEKFTCRVISIEVQEVFFKNQKNLRDTTYGTALLALLKQLRANKFLNSKITHIKIKPDNTIDLYMSPKARLIEFGKPEDIAEKFEKLMVYYGLIIPAKGLDRYKRINLEFRNQIVCE